MPSSPPACPARRPRVDVITTGQGIFGAYHPRVVRGVKRGLKERGHDFHAVIGSSAGAFTAMLVPEGSSLVGSDAKVRQLWRHFVGQTGIRASAGHFWNSLQGFVGPLFLRGKYVQPRSLMPHSGVLQEMLNLIERDGMFDKALNSETILGFVATEVNYARLPETLGHLSRLGFLGAQRLVARTKDPSLDRHIDQAVSRLEAAGEETFVPRYFVTRWPQGEEGVVEKMPDRVTVLKTPAQVRLAVEASTFVPFFSARGLRGIQVIEDGPFFVDGAYSNNTPLELALEMGGTDVFVLGDSRKPNPDYYHRQEVPYAILEPLARLLGLRGQMRGIDVGPLRERYAGREISIIGRDPDFPKDASQWERFFGNPEMVARILDLGPKLAKQILDKVDARWPEYAPT